MSPGAGCGQMRAVLAIRSRRPRSGGNSQLIGKATLEAVEQLVVKVKPYLR